MTLHIAYHSFADFAGVTVTGGVTDTGYAVARALERHRHTRWQGTIAGGAWQVLRFDLGQVDDEEHLAFFVYLNPGVTTINSSLPVGSQTEQANCRAGSLTINVNRSGGADIVITDDGAGNLVSADPDFDSGTITYLTGAFTINFAGGGITNPILDATFDYDRMLTPTYAAIVDGKQDAATHLTSISLTSYTANDWATGGVGVSVTPDWTAGVLFSLFTPAAPRRYWEVGWPFDSVERVQGASVVMLGKVLTLSEGMAAGFDTRKRKLIASQKRDRAGYFLPMVIEGVEQDMSLKFGAAGLACGDLAFSNSKGLLQTPSIDRFERSYWSRGIPFVIHWEGPEAQSFWARGRPQVSAPWISAIRRGLRLDVDVMAEQHMEQDS